MQVLINLTKKFKIMLLSLALFIAIAYVFRGPDWPEEKVSQQYIPTISPEIIDIASALASKTWDEELQEKFLLELRGKEMLPKFEDYPAMEFSNKKHIVVDLNSDPIGRLYRTAIRYSVERVGINFAGKYSIAEWGCGSPCQDGVIVDADTGDIYPLPGLMMGGLEARKDSRLLIYNPIHIGREWPKEKYQIIYWEWTGKGLELLGVYRVDVRHKKIIELKEEYAYYSGWVK